MGLTALLLRRVRSRLCNATLSLMPCLLLASCTGQMAPSASSTLPGEAEFIWDSELCEHMRGEMPEPGVGSSDSPTIDDINRACGGDSTGNYKARPATPSERLELTAFDTPSRHGPLPSRQDLRRSEVVTVITDTSGKRSDVAVVTSETRWIDSRGDFHLRSYLGIFVRSLSRKWRIEHTQAQSGCDGRESQPTSYSLAGFGDVRRAGSLALLFDVQAYESWGMSAYELGGARRGRWLSPAPSAQRAEDDAAHP
jgi:hypothetical protein